MQRENFLKMAYYYSANINLYVTYGEFIVFLHASTQHALRPGTHTHTNTSANKVIVLLFIIILVWVLYIRAVLQVPLAAVWMPTILALLSLCSDEATI